MALYRIKELSFIDNLLVQPGTEIETEATPAAHWEPLDKAAKAASKTTAAAEFAADEAGRAEAAARAAADNPARLIPLPEHDIERLKAEAQAAEAAASAAAEEAAAAEAALAAASN